MRNNVHCVMRSAKVPEEARSDLGVSQDAAAATRVRSCQHEIPNGVILSIGDELRASQLSEPLERDLCGQPAEQLDGVAIRKLNLYDHPIRNRVVLPLDRRISGGNVLHLRFDSTLRAEDREVALPVRPDFLDDDRFVDLAARVQVDGLCFVTELRGAFDTANLVAPPANSEETLEREDR